MHNKAGTASRLEQLDKKEGISGFIGVRYNGRIAFLDRTTIKTLIKKDAYRVDALTYEEARKRELISDPKKPVSEEQAEKHRERNKIYMRRWRLLKKRESNDSADSGKLPHTV